MAIKKVWIEEGCISCGLCSDMCPDVFEMPDEALVIEGADLEANEGCIKESAEECPVEVIKYEE
jgi:ferredoxin